MNLRLSMLAVLLIPGLGPLACGHRFTAFAALMLALVPLFCGLPLPYYAAAWLASLLIAVLLTHGRASSIE
jgi:hypothetical protein